MKAKEIGIQILVFCLKSILLGAILWILGKFIDFDNANFSVSPKGTKKDEDGTNGKAS